MPTPTLFPIARRTDPPTSHQAARALTQSGKLARHAAIALDLVIRYPDKTSSELEALAGFGRDGVVRKRLATLRQQGLIVNGPARKCSISGSNCMVWRVATH